MFKKKKFLIGGIIILVAVGFLGFRAFAGAATYYYKVGELAALGESAYGKNLRVEGQVAVGTVQITSVGRLLKFTIVDDAGQPSIPVVYEGVVPDTFKEGNPVVVEGSLGADGVFKAQNVMPKCPSKYEPATPSQSAQTATK